MSYDEWLAQKVDEHFEDDFEETDDFDPEMYLESQEAYREYIESIQ